MGRLSRMRFPLNLRISFSGTYCFRPLLASTCNIDRRSMHSFNLGSHVMKLRLCNRGGIKVAQPRAHHMISNIEGVHRFLMRDVTRWGCKSHTCLIDGEQVNSRGYRSESTITQLFIAAKIEKYKITRYYLAYNVAGMPMPISCSWTFTALSYS